MEKRKASTFMAKRVSFHNLCCKNLRPLCISHTKDPFVCDAVESTVSRRIVPIVIFATHRTDLFVFNQQLKGVTRVLAYSVRILNRARSCPVTELRHNLRIRHPLRQH